MILTLRFMSCAGCSCQCIISVCVCVFSMNGALAFVDTSDCTLMNIAEHYMASDVEWDPTGRYVVTSVSWWSHKVTLPRRHRDIDSGYVYLLKIFLPCLVLVCRWTTHTGCGRFRAVSFRRTTKIASVSCSGDPDRPPCSVQIKSRYPRQSSQFSLLKVLDPVIALKY